MRSVMIVPRSVRVGSLEYEYTPWDVYYWFAVLVTLVTLGCLQRAQSARTWMRHRLLANGVSLVGKPSSIFHRFVTSSIQLCRSIGYYQTPSLSQSLSLPSLGTSFLIAGHAGLLFALLFWPPSDDVSSQGFRAGWAAISQLPLLVALIGKNNLVSWITNVSYERLNVFHRWIARTMLLFASLHLYFFYKAYGKEPGLFNISFIASRTTPTGFAAFAILIWMNLSALGPIRRACYEFFLVQHLISWFGLFICLALHVPVEEQRTKIYLYLPLALYLADRLFRYTLSAHHFRRGLPLTMLTPFTADQKDSTEGYTKILIKSPPFTSWQPGSHILLTFPAFGPFESHPATILSTPRSHAGAVVCLLKAETGFTRILYRYATASMPDLDPSIAAAVPSATTKARLSQPFSSNIPPMSGFETAIFLSAGTGITYNLSLLHALAEDLSCNAAALPIRKVRLIWSVRSFALIRALLPEVSAVIKRLDARSIDVRVDLHITATKPHCTCSRRQSHDRRASHPALSIASSNETLGPIRPAQAYSPRQLKSVYPPTSPRHLLPSSPTFPKQAGHLPPPISVYNPRRSDDTLRPSPVEVEDDDDDDDEAIVIAAFTPMPTAREASVVADRWDLEKGEWRVLHARMNSVASAFSGKKELGLRMGQFGGEAGQSLARIEHGRPDLRGKLAEWVKEAEGEMGVVACGPAGFGGDVRREVARLGFLGRGGRGVWLRVEGQ